MLRWDIFCKVVDNYGDIGTCWRLAKQLAEELAAEVCLWVDDLTSFATLCPAVLIDTSVQRVGSIEIRHWTPQFPIVEVADVVIEAFACEIPESYVVAMAQKAVAQGGKTPVWINLEYLSAETFVEDCHLLQSPHSRSSLTKYFFFPGFTAPTGGLLREQGLLDRRAAFDSDAEAEFWVSVGVAPRTPDELRVSLFCYDNPALPKLLKSWIDGPDPVRVLAAPGAATEQIEAWFGEKLAPTMWGDFAEIAAPQGNSIKRNSLTIQALPFLSQPDYDRLLWSSDVNFVRGEDSFVRAQWAQRPFVWQIYPQSEGTHLVKLDAFLSKYLENLPESGVVRRFWQAWNGAGDIGAAWIEFVANRQLIQRHGQDWAFQLDRTGNLANNLARFVNDLKWGRATP